MQVSMVYTTISSMEEATLLANRAVQSRLAACVNIISQGLSVYAWEGQVQQQPEIFLLFKTAPENLETLLTWLKENHPYNTPALLYGDSKASVEFSSYIKDQF